VHRRRVFLAFAAGPFLKTCLKSSPFCYHDTSLRRHRLTFRHQIFFVTRSTHYGWCAGRQVAFCDNFSFGFMGLTFASVIQTARMVSTKSFCVNNLLGLLLASPHACFCMERDERNIAMRCYTLRTFVQQTTWKRPITIKSFTCDAPFSDSLAGWFCNLGRSGGG